MSKSITGLIDDLRSRGLVAQMTGDGELERHLADESRTVYCGFDPTAESLHIGSLVPLLALRRFQLAGHKPLALVGGATGLIGDPSFKAQERQLNTPDVVAEWVDRIKSQVSAFVDFDARQTSAEVVNNLDWTGDVRLLPFLRDIGKHFSVNNMVNKESVKQRLDREGAGISFTEFTYMLLQSYDFAELNKRYGCTVQLGGSDQWGNITGGIDLTRRLHGNQVFGLTLPLVTKADGTKFGKTESGTIWLDAKKTSPYAFYQFWINTADADIEKMFGYFSFRPVEEIRTLFHQADYQALKLAKELLADEITELVHGVEAAESAKRISSVLFEGVAGQLGEDDLAQLAMDGLPSTQITAEDLAKPLTMILSEAGLGAGKQIKDALSRRAVVVNEIDAGIDDNMNAGEVFGADRSRFGKYFLVKVGKKKHHLFYL